MSVKLLTEHNLGFLSLKKAAEARLSLHLSNYNIVGNHMSQLICTKKEEGISNASALMFLLILSSSQTD